MAQFAANFRVCEFAGANTPMAGGPGRAARAGRTASPTGKDWKAGAGGSAARRPDRQPASAGLMALQASTRPFTESTDLANIAFSVASSSTSTTFSTPLAPITTGTPT